MLVTPSNVVTVTRGSPLGSNSQSRMCSGRASAMGRVRPVVTFRRKASIVSSSPQSVHLYWPTITSPLPSRGIMSRAWFPPSGSRPITELLLTNELRVLISSRISLPSRRTENRPGPKRWSVPPRRVSMTLKTRRSSSTHSNERTSVLFADAARAIGTLPSTSAMASATRPLPAAAVIASHLPEGESFIALTSALRKKVSTSGSAVGDWAEAGVAIAPAAAISRA
jgi:hypothetical protein